MNIKVIEGRVYFFTDDVNSVEIDPSLYKSFCEQKSKLNLIDFINYCQSKNTTAPITEQDFLNYCLNDGIVPLPETVEGVGDIQPYVEGDDSISNNENERILQLKDLLNELNVPCVTQALNLSDKLKENTDYIQTTYYVWLSLIGDLHKKSTNYSAIPKNIEKTKKHKIISDQFILFRDYHQQLIDLDNEIKKAPISNESLNVDFATNVQESLLDYVKNLNHNEIDNFTTEINEKKNSINSLAIDDGEDISKYTPTQLEKYTKTQIESTVFYKITRKKIVIIKKIIDVINNLLKNVLIIKTDNVDLNKILILTNKLLGGVEYQVNGFMKDLNENKKNCPKVEDSPIPKYIELLDEVKSDSDFDITNQPITVEDRAYWVKYCMLATKLSIISVPFWATGINISGLPIPLPTVYINLGVIKVKIPIPGLGINISAPFIIVPCLAITGIVVSPYFLFINMSNLSIGPVAPQSKICLFTWRSALTNIVKGIKSEELKPFSIKMGAVNLDLAGNITRLLSIMKRDDLPVYKRLRLSNIPFVVFSLLNVIKNQRKTVGLP
jgi:hypothetical protein